MQNLTLYQHQYDDEFPNQGYFLKAPPLAKDFLKRSSYTRYILFFYLQPLALKT